MFYDNRNKAFPDYYIQQNEYFKLKEKSAARKKYMRDNPELGDYWDWRKDFFHRNPDTVQYLTDDYQFEYKSIEDVRSAQQNQPAFSAQEWSNTLGPHATNLMMDYFMGDENISHALEVRLDVLAEKYGMSREEMLVKMEQSLGQQR